MIYKTVFSIAKKGCRIAVKNLCLSKKRFLPIIEFLGFPINGLLPCCSVGVEAWKYLLCLA